MKRILIITLILGLAEAATAKPTIDGRTIGYMNDLMKRVHTYCDDSQFKKLTQIKIERIPQEPLAMRAYCHKNGSLREIIIDDDYWHISPTSDRYETIAHEALHCLFDAPHSNDKHSIMYKDERNLSNEEISSQVDMFLKTQCHKAL